MIKETININFATPQNQGDKNKSFFVIATSILGFFFLNPIRKNNYNFIKNFYANL